jgi:hypothetical protein
VKFEHKDRSRQRVSVYPAEQPAALEVAANETAESAVA